MSPAQQRQPPQHGVDEHEDDSRVESRHGQQVRKPAAGVAGAEFRGDAPPFAGRHGFDDGCGFGRHRQPGEAFDGGAVQSGGLLWQAFEDRPFRDPQRSGIAPPPHQEAEALRPASERPHRAPAAEAFAGPQVGERVDVEPDPGVGGVPMSVCGVAPCRHRSVGRGIAAPVGGKSFDGNFVHGPDVPRHGGRRRPELCRGESRREEHPHGGRLRTEQQRHDSRAYESPCEKPQGQFIPASQRDPGRERHEKFQDGHAVEPREQAGEFHRRWFIRA